MKMTSFKIPILAAIAMLSGGFASAQSPVSKSEKKEKTDSIPLVGYVYDRLTSRELYPTMVHVLRQDSTQLSSIKGGSKYIVFADNGYREDSTSRYEVNIPRKPGNYIIKITKPGYEDSYTAYKAEIGSRANELAAPKIYLSRENVRQLQEVTVKASKIMVYHKGDTLVYNADAFNLPEGSMLDALVQQLPGVEIKGNEIYVNGKFVESLLLNGKEFFKGDPSVAMHNIGAYSVKDVAVYEKAEESAAILGNRDDVKKEYVMDVRLKKDYMTGTAVNAEAGYGTKGRYKGRLFGLCYTNNSRLSLYGNSNNMNISQQLDENGEKWMSYRNQDVGITSRANAGVDYNVDNARHTWEVSGNADVHYTDVTDHETTNAIQFLQVTDNYLFSDKSSRMNRLRVSTNHNINLKHDSWNLYMSPSFSYNKENNHSDRYSATFNEEFENVDKEVVKNLYTQGYANYTTALVNRIVKLYDGDTHGYNGSFNANSKIKIPNSPDAIEFKGNVHYGRNTQHGMTWQDMCFGDLDGLGANPASSMLKQQNQATHPDYKFRLMGLARYYFNLPFGYMNASYEYTHAQDRKSVGFMMLESLAQGTMAEFQPGQPWIPDFANSYDGKTYKNLHHLKLIWKVSKKYDKGTLELGTEPCIYLERHNLFYNQGGIELTPSKTFCLLDLKQTQVKWNTSSNKLRLMLSYHLYQDSPNLMNMMDIPNTADPMNIWRGNPDLKKSTQHALLFYLYHRGGRIMQNLTCNAVWYQNAFANGYRYNSATGVKEMKCYNVAGTNYASIYHWLYFKFDKSGEWYLNNNCNAGVHNYSNMVGYDAEPTRQKARSWSVSENLVFTMNKDVVCVSVEGKYVWAKSISYAVNPLRNIYGHYGAALDADVKLPFNFSINANVALNKYYGYIEDAMNKTRWLLQAKLNYTMLNGALCFSINGQDLLNQTNGLRMSVDATGSTQTDRLMLGRVVLFQVAYKFHRKPKRDNK